MICVPREKGKKESGNAKGACTFLRVVNRGGKKRHQKEKGHIRVKKRGAHSLMGTRIGRKGGAVLRSGS